MATPDPDSILSQYGVNLSGGSTVTSLGPTNSSDNVNVYMGPQLKRKPSTGPDYGPVGFGQPGNLDFTGGEIRKYNDVMGDPLQWDDSQKRDFISKGILYKIGGFSADMGMPDIMDQWKKLVDASVEFTDSGKGKWSPMDVLNSYATDNKNFGTIRRGDWLYDAATGEKVKYVGPRTKTTTEKRVDLSSAEDVRALTTQMLTELLGRAPTADELAKYRSSINGYENANPSMATSTQTLDDQGEVTNTSTTTSGGTTDAARSMLVTDQARQGPEYGKFQGGTTYWNAMMQMLGGG